MSAATPRRPGSVKVRLLLALSALWCVLSLGLGLQVLDAARAALNGSMVRQMLAIGALAAAQVGPLAPADLQPDLDGRSTPPPLKAALGDVVQGAGLRDLVVLNSRGLALCDATGEALPGAPAPLDLAAARADLAQGEGHVFPARGRDFGLNQQSAVFPLGPGLLLEEDADPLQLRAVGRITAGLAVCMGGLLAGAGLSLLLALGLLRRERALARARARAEDVAAERVRLAGLIAHESRNTLGAILGQAQWLARRPGLEAESADSARKIAQQAEQLGAVMRRLLDFNRPLQARPQPVRVEALFADLKAELERAGGGVAVGLRCPPGLVVSADPELLAAALSNLGRNALEAMPQGGAVLLAAEVRGRAWRLEVHDQGPGVPEPERERVFEPFQSRKPGGTGLGLGFVRKVARAHGGRAYAGASALGGACFTLEGSLP